MEEIKMKTPDGKEVMIDEAMAPIINLFWRRDIHTKFCCAGHPPHAEGESGKFQSYIVFSLDDANLISESIESLIIQCEINPEFRAFDPHGDFVLKHFNISIDMLQNSIIIEANATTDESWLRIIEAFYRIADDYDVINLNRENPDIKYWTIEAYRCVNFYGEDDNRANMDTSYSYPHIEFNFYVQIPNENGEVDEVYLSMDRDYVYSTCHSIEDITDDDQVIIKPVVMRKHNIKLTEQFVRSLAKPMSSTEFISIFGFEPFE